MQYFQQLTESDIYQNNVQISTGFLNEIKNQEFKAITREYLQNHLKK